MNRLEALLYSHLPSFRRESGGTYAIYAALYSRAYAARARRLHEQGRHVGAKHGPDQRCTWCGA